MSESTGTNTMSEEDQTMLAAIKAYQDKGGKITALQPALKEHMDAKSTTKTFVEDFTKKDGSKMPFIKVFKVDAVTGNRQSDFPERKCSWSKATCKLIVKHIDEIKVFAA